MEETFTLSSETFYRILEFAQSPDKENRILAGTVIENSEFPKSIPYVLMIYKKLKDTPMHANSIDDVFTRETMKKLVDLGFSESSLNQKLLSYNQLYIYMEKAGINDSEAFEFFMQKFADEFAFSMKDWGFTFLEKYTLNFTKNETV
jgi:hypothetical protein